VTHQSQTINQQQSKLNLQASKENQDQTIPTTVNGVISVNSNEKQDLKCNDDIDAKKKKW
jgi:hypothetical protein